MAKDMITLITTDGKREITVTVKHADTIFCLQDRTKAKSNIKRVQWKIKSDAKRSNKGTVKESDK